MFTKTMMESHVRDLLRMILKNTSRILIGNQITGDCLAAELESDVIRNNWYRRSGGESTVSFGFERMDFCVSYIAGVEFFHCSISLCNFLLL